MSQRKRPPLQVEWLESRITPAVVRTIDGTATAESDYGPAYGTLTFLPGQTSQTITITVYGDTTHEPGAGGSGETFFVNLSSATNATPLDPQGLGLIQDDD